MKAEKGRCCLSASEFIGPGRNDAHAGHGASGATQFHHASSRQFTPVSARPQSLRIQKSGSGGVAKVAGLLQVGDAFGAFVHLKVAHAKQTQDVGIVGEQLDKVY